MSSATHRRPGRAGLVLRTGLVLLAGLAVGACGGPAAPAATTASAPVASAGSPTPTVSPSAGPASAGGDPRPSGSSAAAEPFEMPGTVSARRGRCVYFTPGDMAMSWVLRGRLTEGLVAGDQVIVTGTLDDVADPVCGTAKVFRVTKLTRS